MDTSVRSKLSQIIIKNYFSEYYQMWDNKPIDLLEGLSFSYVLNLHSGLTNTLIIVIMSVVLQYSIYWFLMPNIK
jgi:hypothetical protein